MPLLHDLRCPDLTGEEFEGGNADLLPKIERFATCALGDDPSRSFGLELRLAHYLRTTTPQPAYGNLALLDKLMLRPAVEPILHRYATAPGSDHLDHTFVNTMVSVYYGGFTAVRTDKAKSWPDENDNYVRFPDSDYAARYLERIRVNLPRFSCAVRASGYIFAEVILSHPYRDGNGRLGRMLSLMLLGKAIGRPFLPIPLGAVITASTDRYIHDLNLLSISGDWLQFFKRYEHYLDAALDTTFAMLGTS